MKRLRLLLCDDHVLIIEGLRVILEHRHGALGFATCDQAAARLGPDVIVIDVGMPILNGIDGGAASPLTARQRQVLKLIASRKQSNEIAPILQISIKTAEFHRSRLLRRVGVRSIAALTRSAIEEAHSPLRSFSEMGVTKA